MQQIELLAPAGDQESLIAAIQNGANAIYLGGTLFNARAFAKNFDHEQLKWAIEYAHLRNVKIYVTVNTLFQDSEFDELLKYINYLYEIQVDALIIQDIGLFHVLRELYPDFEIHISTQASVMNSYGVQYFQEKGASRVVLARENTLDEIKTICSSTDLEIEVFVHGALCVCYSGQCLMSSFIGQRSGNRGACAQPCRLQYKLEKDQQILKDKFPFLLSPKDLMTIDHIGELIDAGVTSFKIEGRMKRPEYVASVVKSYRKAIDNYIEKTKSDLKEDISYMKSMFNRNYTSGYAFYDRYLVDGDYSGNKGVIIGQVVKYDTKRKVVTCQLENSLNQGDSIVFERIDKGRPVNKIYLNKKLVSMANCGDLVEIEFDYPVYEGKIRKTVDIKVIDKLQKTYQNENIKQGIDMHFDAKVNQNAVLTIKYKNFTITKKSENIVQLAMQSSLQEERIEQQLSKLGSTCFYASSIHINKDQDIIIPIKDINELRRKCVDELSSLLMNDKKHYQKVHKKILLEKSHQYHDTQLHIMVQNLNQLEIVLDYHVDYIYYPFQSDILSALKLCKVQNKEMCLFIPRVCKDAEIEEIKSHQVYNQIETVVVNDYGSYLAFCDKNRIVGSGMNIYNSYACSSFNHLKVLSLEMTQKQMLQLQTNIDQCIIQVFGKIENMISDYCPISQYYFGYQNKNCRLCKESSFSLIDRKNEKFDLMMDEHCRMHLLNCKTLWIDKVSSLDIHQFMIHFTNENDQDVKRIMDDMRDVFSYQNKSRLKESFDTTTGYFRR